MSTRFEKYKQSVMNAQAKLFEEYETVLSALESFAHQMHVLQNSQAEDLKTLRKKALSDMDAFEHRQKNDMKMLEQAVVQFLSDLRSGAAGAQAPTNDNDTDSKGSSSSKQDKEAVAAE
jgi:hypothetical protein